MKATYDVTGKLEVPAHRLINPVQLCARVHAADAWDRAQSVMKSQISFIGTNSKKVPDAINNRLLMVNLVRKS